MCVPGDVIAAFATHAALGVLLERSLSEGALQGLGHDLNPNPKPDLNPNPKPDLNPNPKPDLNPNPKPGQG